jgi:hypothetical protein
MTLFSTVWLVVETVSTVRINESKVASVSEENGGRARKLFWILVSVMALVEGIKGAGRTCLRGLIFDSLRVGNF